MHSELKQAFQQRLTQAQQHYKEKDYTQAFSELEIAHVLGQQYLWPHWQVHFAMLKVGLAQKSSKEIAGQIWRIILTPAGHLTGRLPLGNTGGSNVNAFKPMPIAAELQTLLNQQNRDQ